jgi:polar amino acid transport system substrate-binding protein
MKRVAVLVAALALLAALPAVGQSVMKVATPEGTEGFRPLLEAIYKDLGIKVEWVSLPAERALQAANAGDVDADIGRVVGAIAAYPNLVATNEPIVTLSVVAWARKGSGVAVASPADLKKFKVGIVRGQKAAEGLVAALGLVPELLPDAGSLEKVLASGRVEVVLTTNNVVFADPTLAVVNPKVAEFPTIHVLNKKLAALVPRIDAVLKAMKADGRLAKLLGM